VSVSLLALLASFYVAAGVGTAAVMLDLDNKPAPQTWQILLVVAMWPWIATAALVAGLVNLVRP
jgi:hypothetical protein